MVVKTCVSFTPERALNASLTRAHICSLSRYVIVRSYASKFRTPQTHASCNMRRASSSETSAPPQMRCRTAYPTTRRRRRRLPSASRSSGLPGVDRESATRAPRAPRPVLRPPRRPPPPPSRTRSRRCDRHLRAHPCAGERRSTEERVGRRLAATRRGGVALGPRRWRSRRPRARRTRSAARPPEPTEATLRAVVCVCQSIRAVVLERAASHRRAEI